MSGLWNVCGFSRDLMEGSDQVYRTENDGTSRSPVDVELGSSLALSGYCIFASLAS